MADKPPLAKKPSLPPKPGLPQKPKGLTAKPVVPGSKPTVSPNKPPVTNKPTPTPSPTKPTPSPTKPTPVPITSSVSTSPPKPKETTPVASNTSSVSPLPKSPGSATKPILPVTAKNNTRQPGKLPLPRRSTSEKKSPAAAIAASAAASSAPPPAAKPAPTQGVPKAQVAPSPAPKAAPAVPSKAKSAPVPATKPAPSPTPTPKPQQTPTTKETSLQNPSPVSNGVKNVAGLFEKKSADEGTKTPHTKPPPVKQEVASTPTPANKPPPKAVPPRPRVSSPESSVPEEVKGDDRTEAKLVEAPATTPKAARPPPPRAPGKSTAPIVTPNSAEKIENDAKTVDAGPVRPPAPKVARPPPPRPSNKNLAPVKIGDNVQEDKLEAEAEEFEKLCEEKGLMGALGFEVEENAKEEEPQKPTQTQPKSESSVHRPPPPRAKPPVSTSTEPKEPAKPVKIQADYISVPPPKPRRSSVGESSKSTFVKPPAPPRDGKSPSNYSKTPPPLVARGSSDSNSDIPAPLPRPRSRKSIEVGTKNSYDVPIRKFESDALVDKTSKSKQEDDMAVYEVVDDSVALSGSTSPPLPAPREAADELKYPVGCARVKHNYKAQNENEISLKRGDVIDVFECEDGDPWWYGFSRGVDGWFPASYVEVAYSSEWKSSFKNSVYMDEGEEDDKEESIEPSQTQEEEAQLPGMNEKLAFKRTAACEELIRTEEDYVDDLRKAIEFYLRPMRQRIGTLFADHTLAAIFSNLEQIATRHAKFLEDLKEVGVYNVANSIVKNADAFRVYVTYCRNHKRAGDVYQEIAQDMQVKMFFEASFQLAGKQLEPLLLKPIQRICQYPLLVGKILEYTPKEHPDRPMVERAMDIAQENATHINEDTRNKEHLNRLQESLVGWKGPGLDATSTRLIHEGDLMKISGSRCQERHFMLFDNLLIYCKRTLKGSLQVQGKLLINDLVIMELEDGQESYSGSPVKHAFKMYYKDKKKWYICFADSADTKSKWMESFRAERKFVEKQLNDGIVPLINTQDFWEEQIAGKMAKHRPSKAFSSRT
eukprot:m.172288 g.172288  ORF g.172288 m.172288 type:complete len:1046 (+) comp15366_c0_seq1:261-3398(+)